MAVMNICDCCNKPRKDIVSMGRDDNGDPDSPDMCFICRKEWERKRIFDMKIGKYVNYYDYYQEI